MADTRRKSSSSSKSRQAANGTLDYQPPKRKSMNVRLAGEVFRVKVPKMYKVATMITMSARLADLRELNMEDASREDFEAADEAMQAMVGMVSSLFDANDGTKTRPSSRDRFLSRLEDDDDDLDLPVVQVLVSAVVEEAGAAQANSFPT